MVSSCESVVDIDGIDSTVPIVSAVIESSGAERFNWILNPCCVSKDRLHNTRLNEMILGLSCTTDFCPKCQRNALLL